MALSTQPYKGARDFYPEQKNLQNYIFKTWASVCSRFGYQQYDAPIIEPLSLYQAKSGVELSQNQTYQFNDRGGRHVTLRPEMTPSVSRMVAAKRQILSYPLRWYSMPNLWRYERPQRGRLREHWQLNVDIFGVEQLWAEIEMIQMAAQIMGEFGADQTMYQVKVNHRGLMDRLFKQYLGFTEVQIPVISRLIDQSAKIKSSEFNQQLDQILNKEQKQNQTAQRFHQLLLVKKINDLPPLFDTFLEYQQLRELLSKAKDIKIDNISYDIKLMRGLEYYTGIVFELFDNHPDNQRSLFGGGRYDGLVGLFGVDPIPTVGFGMGDVTIENFLADHQLLPNSKVQLDLYFAAIGDVWLPAQSVISKLRQSGISVAVDFSQRKVDKLIKNALNQGASWIIFYGVQEVSNTDLKLKNLQTGHQQSINLHQAMDIIKQNTNI